MGFRFSHVSVGPEHSCGVATGRSGLLLGVYAAGKVGDGTTGNFTVRPVPVSGGLRFRQIRAGVAPHLRANPEGVAYCWGDSRNGQRGDLSHTQRLTPKRVGKSYQFRWVSPGRATRCGVTTGNLAYCWGSNADGQMGVQDGLQQNVPYIFTRSYPYPVSGGLRFQIIDAGHSHTCAVTTAHRAYCWGQNTTGTLGDGTRTPRFTAKRVAGVLQFQQVSAAYFDRLRHDAGWARVLLGQQPAR